MPIIDSKLPKNERILIAAEKIFSQRGYTQTTLDEIISLADTGKGTLYKYFGNKDNLFHTLVESKNTPFVEKLKKAVDAEPDLPSKLSRYLLLLLEFLTANKGLWRVLWYEQSCSANHAYPEQQSDGTWIIKSIYDNTLSAQDQKRLLRYHHILYSEIEILINILTPGFESGQLKRAKKNNANETVNKAAVFSSYHIFAGIAITVFHSLTEELSHETLVELITDSFLNGHLNPQYKN